MPGKKNSSSIETLLDRLFAALAPAEGRPRLDPHMALKPDPAARSYFIAAPRPALALDDMLRPGKEAPFAETERLLADTTPERRAELVGLLQALQEALATERQDGSAEPPSLIYALH